MKFKFIDKHRSLFAVERMCHNLSVSRSAYYAWRNCPVSARKRANAVLTIHIKGIFRQFRGVYGSPRITRVLCERGIACSENRVARLMRSERIRAYTKRKFKITTHSKHRLPVAPNLVNQKFVASKANRLWTSDITYIWTEEGWLYLAVILDVFSRQIVGWAVSNLMTRRLIINALQMAVLKRQPRPGLIFHSDRGSQFASQDVREFLDKHKMLQSMSKKGDCYDNAITETFFKTLKTELVYITEPFKTRGEAKQRLFNYIESFYNCIRKHSAIGFNSPVQYEKLTNVA